MAFDDKTSHILKKLILQLYNENLGGKPYFQIKTIKAPIHVSTYMQEQTPCPINVHQTYLVYKLIKLSTSDIEMNIFQPYKTNWTRLMIRPT